MNTERDKFLTEAMGEQWHENTGEVAGNNVIGFTLCSCGKWWGQFGCLKNTNFSTWPGFGKLWEWAKVHEWWATFTDPFYGPKVNNSALPIFNDVDYAINPDRFADAVYEFLKR